MMVKKKGNLYEVPCNPDHPVLVTSITDRALGRMIQATVDREPNSHAESDLVGDTFFSLWRYNTQTKEEVPPDRMVNKTLVDWLLDTPDFQQAKSSSVGNLASSLVSSGLVWASITSEDALKDALAKQKEAEKKQEKADEQYEEMANCLAKQDGDGAEKARQKGDQYQDQANALGKQASEAVDKLKKNPLAQGMIKQIAKDAADKAEEVSGMMSGWGIDPGEISYADAKEIARLAMDVSSATAKIAELVGRFAKISAKTAERTKAGYTGAVSEPTLTNDIAHLFPTERAFLSRGAPPYMRAQAINRLFNGGGLLGWKPKFEAKRKGSFIAMIDRSGSMWGDTLDNAKAIALGIGRAVLNDDSITDRKYLMAYFDTSVHNIIVRDDDSWQRHIEWASVEASGGTSFSQALQYAIDQCWLFKNACIDGADILFITDGESKVDRDTEANLRDLREQIGTRLLVVLIGARGYGNLEGMADLVINIKDGDFAMNAEKLVEQITEQIVKADMQ